MGQIESGELVLDQQSTVRPQCGGGTFDIGFYCCDILAQKLEHSHVVQGVSRRTRASRRLATAERGPAFPVRAFRLECSLAIPLALMDLLAP